MEVMVNISESIMSVQKLEPISAVTRIDKEHSKPLISNQEAKKKVTATLLHSNNLQKDQHRQAVKLLDKFSDLFWTEDDNLGRTSIVKLRIEIGSATQSPQPPRRIPVAKQNEVTSMIQTVQKESTIQRSTSPCTSPIVLVKKKDGRARFCGDYRRLNVKWLKRTVTYYQESMTSWTLWRMDNGSLPLMLKVTTDKRK